MKRNYWKTIGIIISLLVTLSTTPITTIHTNSIQTYAESTTDSVYNITLSKSALFDGMETPAAGHDYQGEYINPSAITSADDIIVLTSDNPLDNAIHIKPDAFLSDIATESVSCKKTDIIALEIKNYNNTHYDLFYEIDIPTGKAYQTLNTKPDETNTVIHTKTQAFDDKPGFIMTTRLYETENGKFDTELNTTIDSIDWLLNHPSIDIPMDLYTNGNTREIRLCRINTYTLPNIPTEERTHETCSHRYTMYTLFGATWIATSRSDYFYSDNNDESPDNSKVPDIIKSSLWIKTNGHKGDELEILTADESARVSPETYDLTKHIIHYTLKDDNEPLPVGDTNYLIYNKTAGIYETVCNYAEESSYLDILYSNIMLSDEDVPLKHYLLTNNETNRSEFFRSCYDVPDVLNITETEYTDAVVTKRQLHGHSSENNNLISKITFRLDNRNLSYEEKAVDASVIMNYATYDEKAVNYTTSTVYKHIPANTTPLFTMALASKENLDKRDIGAYDNVADTTNLDDRMQSYISRNITETPDTASYVINTKTFAFEPYTNLICDVNQDGTFNLVDIIMQQKYLHGLYNGTNEYTLANFAAANVCSDDNNNILDLCLLKRQMLALKK